MEPRKMSLDDTAFKAAYGREVPPLLRTFYEELVLLESVPVRFTFPDKPFVVEIQYFRNIGDATERNVRNGWFAFAVNTDGFDMLVDLAESELPILQDEFGDVDTINVNLGELLVASREGRSEPCV